MIYLYFFLKFKSQLRRTRPDIIRQFDESLLRSIMDAGGKITGDRFVISAVYNEDKIGFWLDMYILIENLIKNIEAAPDFFGYSLIISSKLPNSPEMLSRFLANYNGVFVNEKAAKSLISYAVFEKPSEWQKGMKRRKYGCSSFYKIKELKSFKPLVNSFDLQNNVVNILEKNEGKNILVLGHPYSQMHEGLINYCNKLNGDFPVLSICFGSIGLGALVDSWSLSIRSLASGSTEEIDSLWEFLFRERIRDEVSDYVIRCIIKFLVKVFHFYHDAAQKKKCIPVVALVNIHLAGNKVTDVLLTSLREINQNGSKKMVIIGTAEDDISEEKLWQWEGFFNKKIKLENNVQNKIMYPKLSNELWEIVYSISLFGRYFSPELYHRLFEEAEINPVMITRAFSILYNLNIIDNIREPRLLNRQIEDYAQKLLEEKCTKVKELVCGRLLSWAGRQNINPCFRLLTIIGNLDGQKQIDDILMLRSFNSDIINETISGIEIAIKSGQFDALVTARALAIRYIFKTTKALHIGKENEIENVFTDTYAEELEKSESHPVLKAQILINLGIYNLSKNDIKEAANKSREAILLGQNKNIFCLPQAYRIFSLVCLSKQQAVESIEYLRFAITNAEQSGNYHELAISGYYMAVANFLYGDIYNAKKFAQKSIKQSLASGRPEWADRSYFLEGRIEFELGHYKEAMEIFKSLQKEPFGSNTYEKESLFAAWGYRCKIYCQDPRIMKPVQACHDADLFEIEAAYLSGNYQKAIDLASSFHNPFLKTNYLYTEQADWKSGFAQCEHFYYNKGQIYERIKNLFHSLSISCLSEQGREEGVQGIQQILRDDTLCEIDPWDAVYFYSKYKIQLLSEASQIDMSTSISMAFKRLQRRAGRIEDIETRRQYLNVPYWNHQLSLAAKEFKLI